MTSYHPPSSFLLAKALSVTSGLSTIVTSQLVSFVSLLCVFLLLRQILKRIGILHTLFGIIFLYMAASLPVFIRLSVANTYDSIAFFLGALALYLSIDLFWEPDSFSIRKQSDKHKILFLFGTFVLGMLTKYSCLLYLSFPFIVLAVRSDRSQLFRHVKVTVLTCVLAIATVTPFYHQRYYTNTGEWMPMSMDWILGSSLENMRSSRDLHKVSFTLKMMRIPFAHFLQEMPIKDSLPYEVWFETWKPPRTYKNGILRSMPNIYVHFFIPIFAIGLLSFLARYRKRGTALSDLGWVLGGCTLIFVIALLRFGYEYPYFPWRVFKAKYAPIVVLWICYMCALGITVIARIPNKRTWATVTSSTALSLVTAMIIINHAIPR